MIQARLLVWISSSRVASLPLQVDLSLCPLVTLLQLLLFGHFDVDGVRRGVGRPLPASACSASRR